MLLGMPVIGCFLWCLARLDTLSGSGDSRD